MKKIAIAALVAAQLAGGAAPAAAAELLDDSGRQAVRTGAFAGARVQVSLDRAPRERVRAGLAVAPTMRGVQAGGPGELRVGRGLELGIGERRHAQLSLAGRPLDRIAGGREAGKGARSNMSPIAWAAIGVGVAALAYIAWFTSEMNEPHD